MYLKSIYLKNFKQTMTTEKIEEGIRVRNKKRERESEDITVECYDEIADTFIRQGRVYAW